MTIDWDAQNAIFTANNKWQAAMRNEILVPRYYRVRFPNNFEIIPPGDERAKGGCDTVAGGKRIDEKIVQWPGKNKGQPRASAYDAFAFELMSCTTEGREKTGWMFSNEVDYILYCFASLDEDRLDCFLIDFPALHRWFFATLARDQNTWPRWRSDQINQTECCVVPIDDVVHNVQTEHFVLERPKVVRFCRRCSSTGVLKGAIGEFRDGEWIAVPYEEPCSTCQPVVGSTSHHR